MPAMMVPAKHEHNYSATIRVVVEDSLGAATFVEVRFQVRWPLVMSQECYITDSLHSLWWIHSSHFVALLRWWAVTMAYSNGIVGLPWEHWGEVVRLAANSVDHVLCFHT